MKSVIAAVTLLLSVNVAADFDEGVAAYSAGDYETAFNEFKPLAEQGDATAQFGLGFMYAEGEGVLQDEKEAVKWYTKAAEQGSANAQFNLGVMYARGEGVLQDDKEAVKWYTKAAEQGYADAQNNLGAMYAIGEGVLQDNVYAHMWGNIASSNGNKNGGKLRDIVAENMTAEQIAEAQRLARECVKKDYKDC